MPSVRKEREASVALLTKAFEDVQGLVVSEYTGMKTPELNELRSKLRPLKGECRIVKNTLVQIALKNSGIEKFGEYFTGPSALVIQRGDAVTSLKVVIDFSKQHENLKVRAGYLNGQILSAAELKAVAALPPRIVLLSQLAGGLQGPLSRFHGVLSASLRNLATALDQVSKKKAAAAPAGGGAA
ncbi:MAG TPA: 50S ribosomal protein L10 [Elusimicrobiota bacterium]|nr:50S ribosomal protein L10 [Elusimicrobiota bacterium]